jgi:hypothetical protein
LNTLVKATGRKKLYINVNLASIYKHGAEDNMICVIT